MNRRAWLLAGAGTAAAVAGVAWQQWPRPLPQPQPLPPAVDDAQSGGLWQMSFAQPDGGTLVMAALRGQPLVLNFWGTWCPPCIKEMPELDLFARQFAGQGWRVVGLAVDNPTAVREFLARSPVSYTIGLAGFEGSELTRQLGNTQGGLPFTVVFNRRGAVVHRHAGSTTLQQLTDWVKLI